MEASLRLRAKDYAQYLSEMMMLSLTRKYSCVFSICHCFIAVA